VSQWEPANEIFVGWDYADAMHAAATRSRETKHDHWRRVHPQAGVNGIGVPNIVSERDRLRETENETKAGSGETVADGQVISDEVST
jgi:hypothetical protein